MTLKEKLSELKMLNNKIYKHKDLISYFEKKSNSITGCNYDKEVVDGTKSLEAPFIKWIYRKIDVEKILEEDIQRLKIGIKEINSLIEKIENYDYKNVLISRYLLFMTFDEISSIIHYSASSVFRFHREGLIELEKEYKKKY
ncbi:MAG: DUF1492 domain-containing protein [Malacoplasma sp.]